MDVHSFVNGRLVGSCAHKEPAVVVSTPKGGRSAPIDVTPEKGYPPQALAPREALAALVKQRSFLALSLPSCPQCDELAEALAARGVDRASAFVKWDKGDPEYPALKAALSVHAGASFTFPQVFADGVYQGGFADVMPKLEMGAYDAILQEAFGTEPTTVKRWVERQPMVVFSLPNCPQCDELAAVLDRRGVPVSKVYIKWDKAMPQYQSLKAQLIQLSGRSQFTFPQTFVRAEYQGSFGEVIDKIDSGALDEFFADAFGVARPELPAAAPAENQELVLDDDF